MLPPSWRTEVAELLEYTAQCIRGCNDRQAVVAFGTAIAYLQREHEHGNQLSSGLLTQARDASGGENTRRFTFAPGELEALAERAR